MGSRQLCNKTGLGDLVSIESKEEWIFLKNTTLKLAIADEYFIGLRKDDRSGQWRWLSNNRPSQKALPWATGQPSGDGNCTIMYKDFAGYYGKYNDLPCKDQVKPGYICEFPVAGCNQDGKSCTFYTCFITIVFFLFFFVLFFSFFLSFFLSFSLSLSCFLSFFAVVL